MMQYICDKCGEIINSDFPERIEIKTYKSTNWMEAYAVEKFFHVCKKCKQEVLEGFIKKNE